MKNNYKTKSTSKWICLTGLCLFFSLLPINMANAQKAIYIPDEWKHPWKADSLLYADNDPENKYTWSKSRSVESDNVIVFWDKGYGATLPSKSPSLYQVDEQDLLKKCEAFYDLEINKLGFVDPATTNLRKYKVMVLLNHTTDWVCYGGGYDFEVSALWLGPSACKPVGHSVAHEVGHSFHYMCYADASHNNHASSPSINTGFHLACGNGQAIWEQTAQWQAAQSYPEQMYSQSINVFRNSHNYAFSHEWHRYQSYWFHYYLCQHYDDIQIVGKVWRQPMNGQTDRNATDFNQALMKLKNLTATDLFRLYYDYAARCATWDFEVCKPYREPYIGDFTYRCVMTGDKTYQVALASTPQSTGFNVIPLQVPAAGTEITTHFTALKSASKLADGDPAEMMNGETAWGKVNRTTYVSNTNRTQRGFRLGYVALMEDNTRQYFNTDSVYCTGTDDKTEDVKMTVPNGVSRLWLIVSPAPKTYVQHKWLENITNAEHWPYRFQLEGTDLSQKATIYVEPTLDNRAIGDATFTYDVFFPATTGGNYTGNSVIVSGQAAATLSTAFQLHPSDIASRMQDYSSTGPSAGKIMFYPCNPKTSAIVKRSSTANGYGHWFNAQGTVCDYGAGYVYSEFNPNTLTFNIGPYPGKGKDGAEYTIIQALHYKDESGHEATARFVFNIHLTSSLRSATLVNVSYNDPTTSIEHNVQQQQDLGRNDIKNNRTYNLLGRKINAQQMSVRKSVYIINGKKVIL
jgi:hypothetical protein